MRVVVSATDAGATLAVVYDVEPGWHIYWENPGDSGLATTVDVSAPTGWTAGPVQYPGPRRFAGEGGLQSFGWGGQVALLVDLEGSGAGEATVSTRWLACKDVCVVGDAERTVSLGSPRTDARMVAWRALLPVSTLPPGAAWACDDEAARLTFARNDASAPEWFPSPGFDERGGRGEVVRSGVDVVVALRSPKPPPGGTGSEPWGVLRVAETVYALTPTCTPSPRGTP